MPILTNIFFTADFLAETQPTRMQNRHLRRKETRMQFEHAGRITTSLRSHKTMDQKETGALAGAPTSPTNSNELNNYTPDSGVQVLTRLLSGEIVPVEEINALPAPWRELAQQIDARHPGISAVDEFEKSLAERPDACALRAAVSAVKIREDETGENEIALQEVGVLAKAPELPKHARLPEGSVSGIAGIGGWLGEFINFASAASPMSPPIFHLALGLTLLSTAIARRVYLPVGNGKLFPNIYTLIVANSTLFAKSTAFDVALRVLQQANLSDLVLPVGITPQSLIGEFTNRQPDSFATWELRDQESWRAERKFAAQRGWLMDEASGLLDSFNQKYTADLLNLVLRLYECPDRLAFSTILRGRQTVRNAYLTICGPTTPAAMRIHLNNQAFWGNGLLARFSFITPDVPPRRVFYPPQIQIPSSLSDSLRTLALERLPIPKEISPAEIKNAGSLQAQYSEEVWRSWDSYHSGLWELIYKRAIPEKFYASYGRFHTLAMKIALQLAAIDWASSPNDCAIVVSMHHWHTAQMIAEMLRASLHRMMTDVDLSINDDLEAKTINLLRQSPTGMSTRELAMALSMTASNRRDELDRLVERMRRDGLIEPIERKGTRGPAAQAWISCQHKNFGQ